ncbi:MAG: GrpB family protein [Egibacteraceae bacterium]
MCDDPITARLKDVVIGEITPATIVVADYDASWPARFGDQEHRIRAALGVRAKAVEHIGSTAVPSLAAKPIIDILVVVADPSDESTYVPALQDAGYALRIREPDFHEHRMLRTPQRDVHVHVFADGSPEVERLLLLRDRLWHAPAERELYAQTKRQLAAGKWPTVQHYAEAKTAVIEQIIARARAARPVPDEPRR